MAALERACLSLYPDFCNKHGVRPDGQTDLSIVASLLEHQRTPNELRELHGRQLMESYPSYLEFELQQRRHQARLEPGIEQLMLRLADHPQFRLGLVTGNMQVTARMKLELFQLNPHFPIGAFGCDHSDRNRLGPIALDRARQHFGEEFEAEQTWIIGDTDRDIAAARALGARALAVATGSYSVEALQSYQPDLCLADLSDTESVLHNLATRI